MSGILRTRGLFKILWNVDQAYSEPCIGHYSAIFRHTQNVRQHLQYSEPFHHNRIPTRIQYPAIKFTNLQLFWTLTYLKPTTYSEPSQRFKMEFFAKIVKSYNYPNILFKHHVLFKHLQPYCGIFRTLCNSCIFRTLHIQIPDIFITQEIFRTLSRHILVYSDRCVTVAYGEPVI